MIKKNEKQDIIDLTDIIKILWKEKILIFLMSSIFLIFSFFISYKSTLHTNVIQIKIREFPEYTFENFRDVLKIINEEEIGEEKDSKMSNLSNKFNHEFLFNLTSLNSIVRYINLKKISYDFGPLEELDEKGLVLFFKDSFKLQKNSFPGVYDLMISHKFENDEFTLSSNFLDDYVVFVKNEVWGIFINQLVTKINLKIEMLKHNLDIAKEIGLEKPMLTNYIGGNNSVVNEPKALFYRGSKVLSQELLYLEKILINIQNKSLKYNPVELPSVKKIFVTSFYTKYLSIAILLGIFLSFILIFVKYNIKK